VNHAHHGGAAIAGPRGVPGDPRSGQFDAPYPIDTSARPSRYVFLPAVLGLVLLLVDVPGLTLREQAHLMWLFVVIPALTCFPIWRWTTTEGVDLTDREIIITRTDGSDREETRIPLSGVSDAWGVGKPFRRHVPFWTHRQGASVGVRCGKEEHWFGLSMREKDAKSLAREIVRRAYRSQGGAVADPEPEA